MTDRPIVLPVASTPDPDALSSVAPREAEVLWEELVQAVRTLAAALENAVLAQRRLMTEADVAGRPRLVREARALANRIEGPPD